MGIIVFFVVIVISIKLIFDTHTNTQIKGFFIYNNKKNEFIILYRYYYGYELYRLFRAVFN